jgi:regulator of RNase E activity RraB
VPAFDSAQRGGFNGLQFPVKSVSIKGRYRHAEHEYLRVPGAVIEKLERAIYNIEITAAFDTNIKGYGRLWPDGVQALRKMYESGLTGPLVIPTIGTIPAFQPEWDHYLGTLYPSDTNLQRMQNRRLLEGLAAEGDVHELPRKVDHWLYFADEEGRMACRDTLTAIGFELEEETVAEDEGSQLPFALVVSRVDSVDKQSINGVTLELVRLAGECRGDYDGWGCEATREAADS